MPNLLGIVAIIVVNYGLTDLPEQNLVPLADSVPEAKVVVVSKFISIHR